MTTGLQLPLTISLTIKKLATDLEQHIAGSYQLLIAEQPCRLPRSTLLDQNSSILTLVSEISEAICQNRERLLTPTLIEMIYRNLNGNDEGTVSLPSETFKQLLTELIRRGFGIHRGFNVVRLYQDQIIENSYGSKEIDDLEPGLVAAKLFEQAIASVDNLSISLWTSTFFQEFSTQQPAPSESSTYFTQRVSEVTEPGSESQSRPLENEKIQRIQEELFYELGILCPLVHLQQSQNFSDYEFQIQINDLRFPTISETKLETVIGILKERIRKNAGAFLNIEIWQYYLKLIEPQFPVLVDSVSKRLNTIFILCILRSLLDEEISVQDLPTVLENLLSINGSLTVDQSKYIVLFPNTANFLSARLQGKPDNKTDGNSVIAYAEAIRTSLKRYISYKYTQGSYTLMVYLLDSKLEEKIQLIDDYPLLPEEHNQLLEAIFEAVQFSATLTYAILTTVEVRKRLRQLIDVELPKLPVLSYQELSPDLNIQPLGRISLPT